MNGKNSVLVVFSMILMASASQAWAGGGCAPFVQMRAKTAQLDNLFGGFGNTNATNKPAESVITDLIACYEPIVDSGQAARVRAEAELDLSTLYGMITQHYRSGVGQLAPGKKSYFDLRNSTSIDPTYEDAWINYSNVVAGLKEQGATQKFFVQRSLGIKIDDELSEALKGLEALKSDARVKTEIQKLKALGA